VTGSDGVERSVPAAVDLDAREVAVNLRGETVSFAVLSRSAHWAPSAAAGQGAAEATHAPFPAVVTEIAVEPGDAVAVGDTVVVIEAMKMLHPLVARGPGVVRSLHVAVGESVETNQILVRFETERPEGEAPEGEPT